MADGAGALPDILQGVPAIADPVDQAGLAGTLRIERCRIDEAPDLCAVETAIARHVGEELTEKTVEKLLQVFAGRAGVAGFQEAVGCAFVFIAPAALDLHTKLVQSILQKGGFDRDTGHGEAAARLQPDLLERGGEVVVAEVTPAAAQGLGEAHGELALAAKVGDCLA